MRFVLRPSTVLRALRSVYDTPTITLSPFLGVHSNHSRRFTTDSDFGQGDTLGMGSFYYLRGYPPSSKPSDLEWSTSPRLGRQWTTCTRAPIIWSHSSALPTSSVMYLMTFQVDWYVHKHVHHFTRAWW